MSHFECLVRSPNGEDAVNQSVLAKESIREERKSVFIGNLSL